MWKKCKVVLVPADEIETSAILLGVVPNHCIATKNVIGNKSSWMLHGTPEHIHIIYDGNVIASTNPSLAVHSVDTTFIPTFVTEYNKRRVIKDVMIEYTVNYGIDCGIPTSKCNDFKANDYNCNNCSKAIYRPKVSKTNNTVIIRIIQESFTREEHTLAIKQVIAVAISFPETFVTGICLDTDKVNNWINNNV